MAPVAPFPRMQGRRKTEVLAPKESLSVELIRVQVEKILASPEFCRAERLSRFLSFAVEKTLSGQPDQLKEYALGVEVFDRNHSYDPHYDPIVRVEARRLRAKLAEYYEKAAQDGLVLISFPKGSYVPVFEQRRTADYAAEGHQRVLGRQPLVRLKTWLLSALALALIVSAVVWWSYQSRKAEQPPELTRLAADFVAMGRPALSWDGTLVTYTTQKGDSQPDIWIHQTAGGEPMNVTRHPAPYAFPSFSHDGTQIVFWRGGLPSQRGIYVISTLGGPEKERKITDFGSNPRFSPDGRWIAFDFGDINPAGAKVYLVSANGGKPVEFLPGVASAFLPHWSADGKHLLFLGCNDWDKEKLDLWVAPLDGGKATKTGARDLIERLGFQDFYPGAWTPSGNGVIVWAERPDSMRLLRIWLSPKTFRAVRDPEHLTQGVTEDCCPSVSRDGRLAFKSVNRKTEIVALPLDPRSGEKAGEPREFAHGTFLNVTPSASADGKKVAYMIPRGGDTWELRLKDLEEGTEQVLVPEVKSEPVPRPVMHPDGTKIAFPWEENRKSSIYVIDATLGTSSTSLERVCEGCGVPSGWSPDGLQLLYLPYKSPPPLAIYSLRVDSREKRQLVRHDRYSLFGSQFSPDGRWISFQARKTITASAIYIVPYQKGIPIKESDWIEITTDRHYEHSACWSPDGDRLYFVGHRDGLGICIWAQPLDRFTKRPLGEAFAVLHDHTPKSNRMAKHVGEFGISQGGSQLFFSTSQATASIWMMQLKDRD
jgi:Tol biopolymer transport system component